jgi:hypothetical protein
MPAGFVKASGGKILAFNTQIILFHKITNYRQLRSRATLANKKLKANSPPKITLLRRASHSGR